jgi:Ca2+-transporting ATPase
VFNCKSFEKSIFSLKTNIYLIGAVLISLFLQLAVLYIPVLSEMFYTVPLNITDWIMILVVTSSIVFFEETRKRLIR